MLSITHASILSIKYLEMHLVDPIRMSLHFNLIAIISISLRFGSRTTLPGHKFLDFDESNNIFGSRPGGQSDGYETVFTCNKTVCWLWKQRCLNVVHFLQRLATDLSQNGDVQGKNPALVRRAPELTKGREDCRAKSRTRSGRTEHKQTDYNCIYNKFSWIKRSRWKIDS